MNMRIIQIIQVLAFLIIFLGGFAVYKKENVSFLRRYLYMGGGLGLAYLAMLFLKLDMIFIIIYNIVFFLIVLNIREILLLIKVTHDFFKEKKWEGVGNDMNINACLLEELRRQEFLYKQKREIKNVFFNNLKTEKKFLFVGIVLIILTTANIFIFINYL